MAFYLTDAELNVAATFTAGTKVSVSADVAAWKAGNAADLTGETVSLVSNAITYEDLAIESGKLNADIIQGTYTAILSLPGYKSQQVTIGAEGLAALTFEYDLFRANAGSWDLTNQNRGSFTLNNGGFGGISMNDPVDDFVFEITFTGAKTESANVVRNEVRLAFDNGKYLGIDLLRTSATGPYTIQTPAWDGNYLYPGYQDHYTLTDDEIAEYNAEAGIRFKVVRQGGTAYIFLNDVLRATLALTGCEDASALLSVYHWDGGLTVNYNYTFSEDPADIEAALQGAEA